LNGSRLCIIDSLIVDIGIESSVSEFPGQCVNVYLFDWSEMPESEMPSSFDLQLLDNLNQASLRQTVLSCRGLFWGIFFEAIAVLILAMTWELWHLVSRFLL
jgi:hypothetical protein